MPPKLHNPHHPPGLDPANSTPHPQSSRGQANDATRPTTQKRVHKVAKARPAVPATESSPRQPPRGPGVDTKKDLIQRGRLLVPSPRESIRDLIRMVMIVAILIIVLIGYVAVFPDPAL